MRPDSLHKQRHRRWIAVLSVAFAVYVGSYISLRNRGHAEASQDGVDGFLYDSRDKVQETHDLSTHYFLSFVFAPLNYLDREVFGGPGPIKCISFDLT